MTDHPDDRQARLRQLADDLRRIDPQKDYYQLTLTASEDGTILWGAYSHFEGFTDDSLQFELRTASIVRADRLAKLYRDLGESCVVVNDDRTLHAFLMLGGHALVERTIAEARFADILAPSPVARTGAVGYKALAVVPPAELQHAPSKKQRARVLKRDGYRCRLCGERPADNVHITLHVHHVRMWSRGGLTEDANLITLCQTCHDGLEPHEDIGLFEMIPGGSIKDQIDRSRTGFAEGVKRYRDAVRRILKKET